MMRKSIDIQVASATDKGGRRRDSGEDAFTLTVTHGNPQIGDDDRLPAGLLLHRREPEEPGAAGDGHLRVPRVAASGDEGPPRGTGGEGQAVQAPVHGGAAAAAPGEPADPLAPSGPVEDEFRLYPHRAGPEGLPGGPDRGSRSAVEHDRGPDVRRREGGPGGGRRRLRCPVPFRHVDRRAGERTVGEKIPTGGAFREIHRKVPGDPAPEGRSGAAGETPRRVAPAGRPVRFLQSRLPDPGSATRSFGSGLKARLSIRRSPRSARTAKGSKRRSQASRPGSRNPRAGSRRWCR